MGATLRAFGIVLALGVAGCSGIRAYSNEHEKNAVVRIRTDSGALLSSVKVDLDLYSVDAACGAAYLGSLKLRDASVDIGLPLGKKILLAYVFSRSSILGQDGTTVIEMMLIPQQGHRYEFDASYMKSGYGATGRELAPGQARGKEIEHARLRDCTPAR